MSKETNTMTTHRSASDLLTIKLRSGGAVEFKGADIQSSAKSCIIKFSGGRQIELKGEDAPSTRAILLFLKKRKEKRAKVTERLPAMRERLAALRRDRLRVSGGRKR
jgi:hypothetical protein